MKDKFKSLTIGLSDQLASKTMNFFQDNLEEEENTTDVINLVLSSHISSMFNMMKMVCQDSEEHISNVNVFITGMMKFIASCEPIENMEMLYSHNGNKGMQ